ncbi:MAG: heavy-metal-associated domain-containing protein [Christensenellaceae bacterium]|nr:heavy-metal-associated domain-containing protein [Christensenellaceae bacterium]
MNLPTLVILLILAAVAVYTVVSYRKKVASGCCGAGGDKVTRVEKAGRAGDYPCHKIALIDGMHCENCVARVANAFNQEDGLMAEVNLPKKRADVYSREPIEDGRIRQLVAKAGYMVTEIQEG